MNDAESMGAVESRWCMFEEIGRMEEMRTGGRGYVGRRLMGDVLLFR